MPWLPVPGADLHRGQARSGRDPGRLRAAIELVEETRERFQLNVSEDLACEALAYRLEQRLGR